jgi:hypothetical protein
VATVESGFALVGDRTAVYREWRISCADGSVETHRAWLLPQSRIRFLEELSDPFSRSSPTLGRPGGRERRVSLDACLPSSNRLGMPHEHEDVS